MPKNVVIQKPLQAYFRINGRRVGQFERTIIIVEEGATLTINGDGDITAVTGNDGYAVISEGTLIINGGTYHAGVDENGKANAVIYARGNGKIYVNGGTFPNEANSTFVLNKKDSDRATTEIVVKGGTFTNFDPANNAAEGAGTNFVAEGYKVTNVGDYYYVTKEDVTANYATEGLVGSVDENECLIFTAAGIAAITATKVNSFDGGSKAADTFVANSLPTMAEQNVGVQSASFTGTKAAEALVTGVSYDKAALANLAFAGTKAEGALVTGVSYEKADINTATFTGKTVDIAATFAGTEGDISVAGKCHDYTVKTAEFVPAAIEVAVGDIVVSEKTVTVQ